MSCPYCSPSIDAIRYRERLREDRLQYESLRRAVQGMIEAGASPSEVTNEIMWRLEIQPRRPSMMELHMARPGTAEFDRMPRIHPDWGFTGRGPNHRS